MHKQVQEVWNGRPPVQHDPDQPELQGRGAGGAASLCTVTDVHCIADHSPGPPACTSASARWRRGGGRRGGFTGQKLEKLDQRHKVAARHDELARATLPVGMRRRPTSLGVSIHPAQTPGPDVTPPPPPPPLGSSIPPALPFPPGEGREKSCSRG